MMRLGKGPFEGLAVRLEPLGRHHREALREALNRDPECWDVQYSRGASDHFESYWAGLTSGRARTAFAVLLRSSGRLVGTTSYLDASPRDRSVEIGSTYYVPEVRGGVVNPETKLLLLTHAFDRGAHRVQFSIDGRNARSQAAVAKLGAVQEAVLRRHRVTWTGHVRDTVIFSIVDREWPDVRSRLHRRVLAALDHAGRGTGSSTTADLPSAEGEAPPSPSSEELAASRGHSTPSTAG
ncbi:MAG TPA: GNAT family protein [Sphingomicrobium sp.]|nr:GNAT family protein [Sphingomicrobium sp.]